MQSNKPNGTKPELLFGKALWDAGMRFRKNSRFVFGKPDFSNKGKKIAVFIDGDFWHGRDWNNRKEDFKSGRDYWIPKIESNIARDNTVTQTLTENGWIVFRFWAKDVCKNTDIFVEQVKKVYNKQNK